MLASHDRLTVETPERVALDLDVAGLGTRILAWLVDGLILFTFWITLGFVGSLFQKRGVSLDELRALDSLVQVAIGAGFFFVQWGYWVTCESLMAGCTPGKRALRIRVVRLDGAPEGFPEAALRNLARAADFLPLFYGAGLLAMLIDGKSRRLGDLLAGTLVVRERQADLSRYESAVQSSAHLSSQEFELVCGFLDRATRLEREARVKLALQLATSFAGRLPAQPAPENVESAEALLRKLVGRG